jgi:hypothetical protein
VRSRPTIRRLPSRRRTGVYDQVVLMDRQELSVIQPRRSNATLSGGFRSNSLNSLRLTQRRCPLSKNGPEGPSKPLHFLEEIWSGRRDSNPRPQPWQGWNELVCRRECAASCLFPRFDALAIEDRGGGAGLPFSPLATLHINRCVDALERAVVSPQIEILIKCRARRQSFGIARH